MAAENKSSTQETKKVKSCVAEVFEGSIQESVREKSVGFDCEFVDPPPEHLIQTECPVCLLIIREPHQVTCCGYSFCHSCVERTRAANRPCPTCNTDHFTDYPNKGLQRTLYSLKVHCSHQREGCEWVGDLGQLDEHLNTDSGCLYIKIQCCYCKEDLNRQSIAAHQAEQCLKRPFDCEHCHNYVSIYDDVVNNHWPVCGCFPVQCPNQCGSTLQRQNLDRHVTEECPLTTISCDFVGCTEKLPRKVIPDHLRENLLTHLSLLASSHANQQTQIAQQQTQITQLVCANSEQQAQIDSLKAENEDLRKLVSNLKLQPTVEPVRSKVVPLLPSEPIKMSNFKQHKKEDDVWFSPPIYTHHRGYKICLAVYANGDGPGKGTHTSVYIHLMKGEYDSSLVWPFRGVVKYQLLDQSGGQDHRTGNSTYHEHRSEKSCGRVIYAQRAQGVGTGKFVSHELLKKYLQNDCLTFMIVSGEVCL